MNNDSEIIALVRGGDSASFAEFVEAYQAPIARYLFRLTGDFHVAQDLAQETFIKAYEGLVGTDATLSFKAWIYRIATNNANQYFRRKKLLSFIPFTEFHEKELPNNDEETECTENKMVIEGVLLKISQERRTCVLLHFVEGLKYDEIGAVLGITPEAARKRVFRGSAEFKKFYGEFGGMKT